MNVRRRLLLLLFVLCVALPASAYYPQWIHASNTNLSAARTVHVAHMNGDSMPDVVARAGDRAVVYVLQPDGTFNGITYSYLTPYLADLAVADVNEDGSLDLIISDTGTNVLTVITGNGDGTFADPVSIALELAPSEIETGDFDGDGHFDVLVRSYSAARLVLFAGDGTGALEEHSSTALSLSSVDLTTGDLDGDGHLDVLITNSDPVALEVYFGVGDGTFTPPMTLAETAVPTRIHFADLDDDGDTEIISCSFSENTLSVRLNTGSRTFGSETTYDAVYTPPSYGLGNPNDFVIFDATEDGNADVVLTMTNDNQLVTFAGTGTGFLEPPTVRWTPSVERTEFAPTFIATGDFTRDGRNDLAVVSARGRISLFENATGELRVHVRATYPTIAAEQTGKYVVWLALRDEYTWSFGGAGEPPYPSGSVTIRAGETILATGSLDGMNAEIEAGGLPPGVHELTARFEGDDDYRPASSNPIAQGVVAGSTTVALSSNSGTESVYGSDAALTASATSPEGDPLSGVYLLYRDGILQVSGSGYFSLRSIDPGTYEFHATFEGTDTQPPGTSQMLKHTIRKSVPSVRIFNTSSGGIEGDANEARVAVDGVGAYPSGRVRLFSSSTLVGTLSQAESAGGNFEFALSALAPGVHYLRAFYDGDARYEAAQSPVVAYRVVPNVSFYVDATVVDDDIQALAYNAGDRAWGYNVRYRANRGPWNTVFRYSPGLTIPNAPERVPYVFTMEHLDDDGAVLARSNADLAMRYPFTDQPLMPGMAIKAQHIAELVEATNVLRTAAGLGTLTLSGVGPGKVVRADHFVHLRNAINESRVALGADRFTFIGATAPHAPIRAQHVQELRDAMQ